MQKEWHMPPGVVTSQIRDSASASEVLERLSQERNNPRLDLIAIAAAWVRLAHLGWRSLKEVEKDPTLDELVDLTLRLLKRALFEDPTPYSQACANMFWASAKLQGKGLLLQDLTRIQQSLNEAVVATSYFMNEQGVANVIWTCSQLKLPSSTLQTIMQSITYRLVDVADSLQPQGASNILLAAAKLRRKSPELLSQMPLMAEVLPDLIPRMQAQQVSNCLWAFEKLQQSVPEMQELIPTIGKRVEDIIPQMITQEVSGTLLVIGQLSGKFPVLRSLLAPLVSRMISELHVANLQTISHACWGLALCGHADARF